MANRELAAKILEQITQNPETFDMDNWYRAPDRTAPLLVTEDVNVCGTILCVAGWAARFTGWNFDVVGTYGSEEGAPWINAEFVSKDGVQSRTRIVGEEALGIDSNVAFLLFHSDEDSAIEALQKIVDTGELDWDDVA